MSSLIRTSLVTAITGGLILTLSSLARADDLTGLPIDDPKDLIPAPPAPATSAPQVGNLLFVPLPAWARGVKMPPLPDQLKPLGKKTLAASAPVAPVTPPKEASATSTTNGVETTTAGGKAPENSPAMITVSPFLQWIKANPQAAAAQARQQAGTYQPGPGGPGTAPASQDDAYWLPPLIDSAEFGTRPVGGSAAIYSTPQR